MALNCLSFLKVIENYGKDVPSLREDTIKLIDNFGKDVLSLREDKKNVKLHSNVCGKSDFTTVN